MEKGNLPGIAGASLMRKIIDAHIHLDWYNEKDQSTILNKLDEAGVESLVCVSSDVESAEAVLTLSRKDSRVKPAVGYHPEQALPSETELRRLLDLIDKYQDKIVAIGEVGLPYYRRKENPDLELDAYVDLLETFVRKAAELDVPIVLHAIYEDAPLVCDLLEKHGVRRAHFHWFKGDAGTLKRMNDAGFFISVTPDCLYEEEIQELIKTYPLKQMMVETDGPWPFEGPFHGKRTHPKMIHQSIQHIAKLKQLDLNKVYKQLYQNTVEFYDIRK